MVKWPFSIVEMRPQAMVQAKQAALVCRFGVPSLRGSCMASAEILWAPSNCTSRMLRVGMAPTSLMTFISTWVPNFGRPWPVTAFSASTFLPCSVAWKKRMGSLMLPTPLVPRQTSAFRFLDAMTVPTPERPAARCRSFTTAAYRQPCSAARPTQAMRMSGSWCLACRRSSVSHTEVPHRSSAGISSAFSFSTYRYTGCGDLPSKMIMSQPAIFISAPMKPPELEHATAPVSGLLVTTE